MRIKVLNASVAVLMAAGVVTAAPSAAADDWKVETQDNSAGFTHTHTEVVWTAGRVSDCG